MSNFHNVKLLNREAWADFHALENSFKWGKTDLFESVEVSL